MLGFCTGERKLFGYFIYAFVSEKNLDGGCRFGTIRISQPHLSMSVSIVVTVFRQYTDKDKHKASFRPVTQ